MEPSTRYKNVTHRATRRRIAAVALSVLTVMVLLLSGTMQAGLLAAPAADASLQGYASYSDNWRIGFGCAREHGYVTDYDVSQLCAGWYHDWGTLLDPPRPDGMEYMQLIRVSPDHFDLDNPSSYDWDDLDRKIAANLGSTWMIGNEPDGVTAGACDMRYPEEYARIFKIFYDHIKGEDATAQITNGPIIQGTPVRMDWLSQVWDAYQSLYGEDMPVDIWNMHNQMVKEAPDEGGDIPLGCDPADGMLYGTQDNDNIDLFIDHVVRMRQWMKDHGQQSKQLIISEYGVLQPEYEGFTMDRINRFMDATFTYLLHAKDSSLGMPDDEYRLVQRWNWFALNTPLGTLGTQGAWNGNLFDVDTHEITEMGLNFSEFVCSGTHATPTPDGVQPNILVREAEESTTHGNMQAGELSSASKCRFVYVPEDAGGTGDSDATYNVRIPSTGNYYVWIRGYGIDYANKSVNLEVSGYPSEAVYFSVDDWNWQKAETSYYLQGPRWATIILEPRVGGLTKIDMLVVTADSSYNPATDSSLVHICNPTPTPTPTLTNTPTTTPSPTISRTPMPTGPAKILGQVQYQGRPAAPNAQLESALMVSAHLPGDPIPAYQFDLVSSDSGEFEVAGGVLTGTYDVGVRDNHSLRNIQRNVAVTVDTPQLDMGELVEGDSNLDNRVSLLDYTSLAPAYGTSSGDAAFDESVDFNQDGEVSLLDFTLLASNYGQEGDIDVGGLSADGGISLKAGSGAFSVVPANQTVSIGQEFSADVYFNSGADNFNGVDFKLYFDPTYFDVVSVVPSGILNMELANQTYSDHIWYASGRINPITGSQLILTLNLRSKAAVSNSLLDMRDFEAAYEFENLTTSASDGRVTVLAHTATPTRTNTPDYTRVPDPTETPPSGPGLGEIIIREGVDGYTGMDDTYIDAWDPNQCFYTSTDLKLRAQDVKRVIWRADVSQVPAGTVIEQAVLTLYQTSGSNNIMTGRVYELLKPWEPSETTWVASDDGIPWTVAGAASIGSDRSGAVSAETDLFPTWGTYPGYPFDFDITSLVQEWINSPSSNNGLIIYNGEGPNSELVFGSCDQDNENLRPRLMIRYYTGDTPTPTVTPTGPTPTPTIETTPTLTPSPETTTLDVIQDTYINAWDTKANYGYGECISLRTDDVQQGLVQFDLRGGPEIIPPYAHIVSAELRMYQTTSGAPDLEVGVYGLLRAWQEYEATWEISETDVPWTIGGAASVGQDRESLLQDTTVLTAMGWYSWEVTEIVQRWSDDHDNNFGLILRGLEGPANYHCLASKEQGTGANKAQLVITWIPGAPPETPTPTPTLTPTATPTVDGGIIEGHVYVDLDGDNSYDLTEGVSGAQVRILAMQQQPGYQETATSAASGQYRFEYLPLDVYQVELVGVPDGYTIVDSSPISVGAGPGFPTAIINFRVATDASEQLHLPILFK